MKQPEIFSKRVILRVLAPVILLAMIPAAYSSVCGSEILNKGESK